MVGHARRKELGTDLRAIFAAADRKQALTIAASVAEKWRQKGNEKVAEHLEEHIEECLSCLAFPESHRRRIRTTNGLENPHTQYGYNSLSWPSSVSPTDQLWYPRIHFWRV